MKKDLTITIVILVVLILVAYGFYYSYRLKSSPPIDPLLMQEELTPEQKIVKENALNDPELDRRETLTPEQTREKQLLLNKNK